MRVSLVVAVSAVLVGCGSEGGEGPTPRPFDRELDTSVSGGPEAPPGAVAYPEAPYGYSIGSIIPNLRFFGWRNPQASQYDPARLETLSLADYYDPDGSGGARLLHVNLGAVWCAYCRAEHAGGRYQTQTGAILVYRPIETEIAERQARGFRYLGVLVQDDRGGPAGEAELVAWAEEYRMTVPFVLDGNDTLGMVRVSQGSFPTNFLIDPRTMRIEAIIDGADPEGLWRAIDRYLP